jgi:catechol 2,3-dioxygenase-like lactoylglutathione lyase family enzyme
MTATTVNGPADKAGPRWRGVNHLALATPDMDATVRFYHGVLRARVVSTIATAEFRHYFFEFGPSPRCGHSQRRGRS